VNAKENPFESKTDGLMEFDKSVCVLHFGIQLEAKKISRF
jgi:hypothetical protein